MAITAYSLALFGFCGIVSVLIAFGGAGEKPRKAQSARRQSIFTVAMKNGAFPKTF